MSMLSRDIKARLERNEFDGDIWERLPKLIAELEAYELFAAGVQEWRDQFDYQTTLYRLQENLEMRLADIHK